MKVETKVFVFFLFLRGPTELGKLKWVQPKQTNQNMEEKPDIFS